MKNAEAKKSWRDVYKVHPAANFFPMMPEDELRKLGEDIKQNGLTEPIVLYSTGSEDYMVLDGRNRLDAMELVGLPVLENQSARNAPDGKTEDWGLKASMTKHYEGDPYSHVISKNIRRRHLTKEQQADLIVKVMASADSANMARPVKRDDAGKLRGSEKDPVKQKAIEEGAKLGISQRTMERSIAKVKGPTQSTGKKIKEKPPLNSRVNTVVLERKPKIKPDDVFAKGGLPRNTTISSGVSKLEQAKKLFEIMSSSEQQKFLRWLKQRKSIRGKVPRRRI